MDRIVLAEALSDLLAYIQENVKNLTGTSAEVITENTLAISTAKIKLSKIQTEPEQSFSAAELYVMYWAVWELREDARDVLDAAGISGSGHTAAVDAEKSCNRLLRLFRHQYKQAGMAPPQEFPRYYPSVRAFQARPYLCRTCWIRVGDR